jgi:hypothetical protein
VSTSTTSDVAGGVGLDNEAQRLLEAHRPSNVIVPFVPLALTIGVSWAGLVGRLATDDIRWHHLLYRRWRSLMLPIHESDQVPNLGESAVLHGRLRMYVPLGEIATALRTDPVAAWDAAVEASHALVREGLIFDEWRASSEPENLRERAPDADEAGLYP